MKGKASDICTKCKHCEGLDIFGYMYSCKHYNKYPDAAIGIDSEIECCNFEEVNMNKIEGKAGAFCPKCKNCKDIRWEYDGKNAAINMTSVTCEDPYNGLTREMFADDEIRCSMFDPKPPCETCERFDGLYCHSLKGITTPLCTSSFGKPGNCPSYEKKKEKESFNLNMPREALEAKILDLFEEKNRLNAIINSLEKEKAADSDCYKEMSELLKEKLKNANELADSWKRDYERIREQFLCPIYNILYPDKMDLDINVTDLLNNVKNLKVYSEENGTMYKEIQEWREKCTARGNEISKLQNIVTEKDVEIKRLKTEIAHLGFDKATVKDIIKKNPELNQTISDQEVTIKALLITIKEMCKEENENA